MRLHFLIVFLLSVMFKTFALSQYHRGCATDFGLGYVSLIPSGDNSIPLFPSQSKENTPFATLRFGIDQVGKGSFVTSLKLTILSTNSVEGMHERLIEVYRVDEYGLPILDFSSDSEWVRVSLDCRKITNPPSAWLRTVDSNKVTIPIKSWAHFFEVDWPVVFHCDSLMAFYSDSNETARIFPKLRGHPGEPDYCMRVLSTSGKWMHVYLESPSTFMTDHEARHARYETTDSPPKVWIRYLDDHGRPRIWYLWD